jgi:excisionase family DNA binding protein
MSNEATLPRLLTPAEVANVLRQDRATIYRKLHAGVIPSIRLDDGRGAIRIPLAEFEAWLERDRDELGDAA